MAKTRIVLADDHAVLRAGVRMLVNAQPDLEVVAEAATTVEALEQVHAQQPDVLLLDLKMLGGGSIKLIERLRKDYPQTRVLVLTMHDDPAYLRAVLAAGGAGYVVKTAADAELMMALRAVARGRTFVNARLAEEASQPTPSVAPDSRSQGGDCLSAREREVLVLLAKGHTNQEIGQRLFLSVKTVETYRARIAQKLGLRTRADLVRYALETGLLSSDPSQP